MPYKANPIYKFILALIFVFLIGYALFNARFLIAGPQIDVVGLTAESNTIETKDKNFTLTGTTTFSSYITVNDLPIIVDENGNFKEKFILSERVTPIKLLARDRFGKKIQKNILVVYTGDQKEMSFDEIITEMFKQNGTHVETPSKAGGTNDTTDSSPQVVN